MKQRAAPPFGGFSRHVSRPFAGRQWGLLRALLGGRAPTTTHPAPRRSGQPRPLILPLALSLPLLLAGCADFTDLLGQKGPPRQSLRPVPRAEGLAQPQVASVESRLLAAHYAEAQTRDLARGLLRMDGGGGADTTYDRADLVRNFERIAFYSEHRQGDGLEPGDDMPGQLLRWQQPVRMRVEFGASVPEATRDDDRAVLRGYVRRLSRATGHAMSLGTGNGGNFHVLVMGEDDRAEATERLRALVPNLSARTLNTLRTLPRDVPCLVMGFAGAGNPATYDRAVALVRAELPELMRRACFHEEIAQGLGLRNDSLAARPSIFNDDGEFALLTVQDEAMLRILYDARLRPGMSLDEAHPIIEEIAAELMPAPEGTEL
ncbi:DUF2927 domain-containing protein [Pseudooceanicola sp. 200-1SW]|uniref:DUF2927 domain-containing protein n=1 Tax=Pseudooceanicola sp. 200-1SW TaxID=3425949 RepID=UPI003D7F6F43